RLDVPLPPPDQHTRLQVVAAANGHGLDARPLKLDAARQTAGMRLPAEQVLRVRLIDLQGAPVVGLRCRVLRVTTGGRGGGGFLGGVARDFGFWPDAVATDRSGRVALRGFGAAARVVLEVADDRFARTHLKLRADGPEPARERTTVLSPAQLLEGVVIA